MEYTGECKDLDPSTQHYVASTLKGVERGSTGKEGGGSSDTVICVAQG